MISRLNIQLHEKRMHVSWLLMRSWKTKSLQEKHNHNQLNYFASCVAQLSKVEGSPMKLHRNGNLYKAQTHLARIILWAKSTKRLDENFWIELRKSANMVPVNWRNKWKWNRCQCRSSLRNCHHIKRQFQNTIAVILRPHTKSWSSKSNQRNR